jgi:hypothetical protein
MLLIRPLPIVGESVENYVTRLAFANGYTSVRSMYCRHFGGHLNDIGRISIDQITNLTGHGTVLRECLWLEFYRQSRITYRYKGQLILNHQVIKGEVYCPLCLASDGVWRSKWHVGWMPFCETHHVLLLSCATKRDATSSDTQKVQSFYVEAQKKMELLLLDDAAAFGERMCYWMTSAFAQKCANDPNYTKPIPARYPANITFPLTPRESMGMYEAILDRCDG